MAADHNAFANLIWQIADLLRGPYRPQQYERVMLPMTVLRRFDCVLAETKAKVVAAHEKHKGGKLAGEALDSTLNKVAGQRFHNRSPLDFAKLKGDPDNINKHLVSYIKGFSANVQRIFEYFELEAELEKMHEANILYLVVSKFADVDLHPSNVPNEQMGLIFENLIRRFNELANETAGDHFTPRESALRRRGDDGLEPEPRLEWPATWDEIEALLKTRGSRWKATEQKLFRSVFTQRDPKAEPVPAGGRGSGFEADADLRDF